MRLAEHEHEQNSIVSTEKRGRDGGNLKGMLGRDGY